MSLKGVQMDFISSLFLGPPGRAVWVVHSQRPCAQKTDLFACIAHAFSCDSAAPRVDHERVCYENSDLWQQRSVLHDEHTLFITKGCLVRWRPHTPHSCLLSAVFPVHPDHFPGRALSSHPGLHLQGTCMYHSVFCSAALLTP